MPIEPEKNIERLLKEHAQKRREEAGALAELHPVTRKLLQAEVARTYGQPVSEAQPKPSPWAELWRRLAVAASFAALLLVVSLVWMENHRPPVKTALADYDAEAKAPGSSLRPAAGESAARREFANQDKPVATASESSSRLGEKSMNAVAQYEASDGAMAKPQAAAATAPEPEAHAARELKLAKKVEQDAALRPATAAPMPAAKSGNATTPAIVREEVGLADQAKRVPEPVQLRSKENLKTERQGGFGANATTVVTVTGSSASSLLGRDGAMLPQSAGNNAGYVNGSMPGQRFVQSLAGEPLRRNFNSPPMPQVLQSFVVQQNGATLNFIDGDGSVYTGDAVTGADRANSAFGFSTPRKANLELEEAGKNKMELDRKPAFTRAAGATAASHPESTLYFRAAGTNRTLNQAVSFEGALLNPELLKLTVTNYMALGMVAHAAGSTVDSFSGSTNLLIRGRVMIGTNTELQIYAVPERP